MGDFFTSPKEKASKSLYDAAMRGQTPWDAMINQKYNLARQGVRAASSSAMSENAGDIMSSAASMGIAPGSSVFDQIMKGNVGIAANEQGAMTKIGAEEADTKRAALTDALNIGVSGLSSSSTGGDVLAGLTTLAELAAGIAVGGGPQGLALWGAYKGLNQGDEFMAMLRKMLGNKIGSGNDYFSGIGGADPGSY